MVIVTTTIKILAEKMIVTNKVNKIVIETSKIMQA